MLNNGLTAWLRRRYRRVVLSLTISTSVSEVPAFSKGMTASYQNGSSAIKCIPERFMKVPLVEGPKTTHAAGGSRWRCPLQCHGQERLPLKAAAQGTPGSHAAAGRNVWARQLALKQQIKFRTEGPCSKGELAAFSSVLTKSFRESTLFLLNLHNINSAEAQLLPTACSVVWQLTSVIAHNMPRRSNRSSRMVQLLQSRPVPELPRAGAAVHWDRDHLCKPKIARSLKTPYNKTAAVSLTWAICSAAEEEQGAQGPDPSDTDAPFTNPPCLHGLLHLRITAASQDSFPTAITPKSTPDVDHPCDAFLESSSQAFLCAEMQPKTIFTSLNPQFSRCAANFCTSFLFPMLPVGCIKSALTTLLVYVSVGVPVAGQLGEQHWLFAGVCLGDSITLLLFLERLNGGLVSQIQNTRINADGLHPLPAAASKGRRKMKSWAAPVGLTINCSPHREMHLAIVIT
ncbi:hypothetical protein Anapl_13572 [Anas platyrhynchos]|uniref:Uncharacterized protein n=1 Tax=Anas platyrhynchos TaxID=8839 RepID=R0LM52_ANAPL|nr:hypothetical protein Anapl_13572 [Anas platyrhynchos]